MRPGRAADLPALVDLWRQEVNAGGRDSVPPEADLRRLLAHFDWEARSRVVAAGTPELCRKLAAALSA